MDWLRASAQVTGEFRAALHASGVLAVPTAETSAYETAPLFEIAASVASLVLIDHNMSGLASPGLLIPLLLGVTVRHPDAPTHALTYACRRYQSNARRLSESCCRRLRRRLATDERS
ncbi:Hypothetical protein UVM_LOCUS5 [uncultured virus]|nr:Hypothetical protein UVM_LOCUS5 [uncultured virus]